VATAPRRPHQALFEVISGFLSQLTDTSDPAELSASMRDYRERGRRVALTAYAGATLYPLVRGLTGPMTQPGQSMLAPELERRSPLAPSGDPLA
jgi:hypothetical protein